ncbi:SRPBCC domain-containing protein [Nannocystis radixulma]|uniref:SRPBCC domain-containing protein n=1 Tax=Nannocystis radixulma TaxID=2995305 RepID=A0ABT5BIT8_9BACT|nr:SRPBCC domain-containing protein [Nannocystis radixulma]MDC0673593.1 SRPBCC domain-containing protein [Nannocystis radixulma]
MSTGKPVSPETTADRELVITRVFSAPRELVWKVWTDPAHVVRWWGPRGHSTTIREHDVRPGGVWRYVMHGPNGVDYDNRIRYTEVVAPERLVYHHDADRDDDDDQSFHVTVTFQIRGEQTEVVMRTLFRSAAVRDRMAQFASAGAASTFDRLGELLADLPVEFVITRSFGAPRELVYRAFTEAERLAQWWGPRGFTMRVQQLDLRPGGTCHYSLRATDGREMWARFTYLEIDPPGRVVFINAFADAAGTAPVRPPFPDPWPSEILNTMTLTEKDGKTTVTLRGVPHNATAVERATFLAGHSSLQGGFGSAFDELAAHLARS